MSTEREQMRCIWCGRGSQRESKWAWNEWKRNSFVWVKNKGKIIVWPRPCQKRVEREKWKRKQQQQQQRRPEEKAYQRNARKQVEKQKWLCANIKINSIYFYFIFHLIVHGFFSFASLRKRSCFSQFSPHFSFGHFCCEVFALGFFFSLSLILISPFFVSNLCFVPIAKRVVLFVRRNSDVYRLCSGRLVSACSTEYTLSLAHALTFDIGKRITIISYL